MAKILVVDDDPVMQMTVRPPSERARHGGAADDDARKDFAEFKTGHLDLVFLDFHADDRRTGDREAGWRTATYDPDHRDVRQAGDARSGFGTRLSGDVPQAWRGAQPARAFQAAGFAGNSRGIPRHRDQAANPTDAR